MRYVIQYTWKEHTGKKQFPLSDSDSWLLCPQTSGEFICMSQARATNYMSPMIL